MAITYHAGRRIQATQADFDGTPAVSGGWVELARTTLGSASSTITVSSLPDKRYYKVLTHIPGQASNSDVGMRLNGDSGSNYARRFSTNGGSDISGTVTSLPWHYTDVAKTDSIFVMGYLTNLSSKEKLSMSHGVRQTGVTAGAPSRFESVGKWANTSNVINEIQILGSSNFNSGSEVVVLGWDPADTHTTNFWEELASANATSNELSTGTFTAKKYLWVQYYLKPTGGTVNGKIRLNNDTGSNYSDRINYEGGEDTHTSLGFWFGHAAGSGGTTTNANIFCNMFIINNSSNEKLAIQHLVDTEDGTGAANAPSRSEWVNKWSNTSSQITQIDIDRDGGTGTYDSTSFIKVWGSN